MEAFDFGLRIKEVREAKKLTQSQVAERIGVSKTSMIEYEKNAQVMGYDKLKKLALLYGTTSDYLIGLERNIVVDTKDLTERQVAFVREMIGKLISEFRHDNKSQSNV